MKTKKFNIGFLTVVLAVVFSILVAGLAITCPAQQPQAKYTEIANCRVIDKHTTSSRQLTGGITNTVYTYYLTLLFDSEHGELEETIEVSERSYNEGVEIGDEISCRVAYNENSIVRIEVMESSITQITDAYRMEITLYVAMASMMFIVAAVVLGFFLTRKKDVKKE